MAGKGGGDDGYGREKIENRRRPFAKIRDKFKFLGFAFQHRVNRHPGDDDNKDNC